MHVKLLTGRYAGQERDVRPDAAKAMLADGRATAIGEAAASSKGRRGARVAAPRVAVADASKIRGAA